MRNRAILVGLSLCLVVTAMGVAAGTGSDTIRDGFEGPRTAWIQEKTDAVVQLLAHERTKLAIREGLLSEGFQFRADVGSGFFYSYALPKIPIDTDLKVSLAVRSDRSGVQLLGRVIIPEDVDPDSGKPSYVTIAGTILEGAERWSRLELLDLPVAVERQARLLRVSTKRKVNLKGAYLDRLIVNLYGGPGETTVYLDDLKIGPVSSEIAAAYRKTLESATADRPSGVAVLPPKADDVSKEKQPFLRLDRSGLSRQGYPWVFTAVRAPGADPEKLRRAGFDLFALPVDSDPALVKSVVDNGMWLMPELDEKGGKLEPGRAIDRAKAFPSRDKVAFWSIGRDLGRANDLADRQGERDRVRAVARALREMGKEEGVSGLSTGTVVGLFPDYSRAPENLSAIGVNPFGWGTTQDASEMFTYLEERRHLTAPGNPDGLYFAWIKATPPPIYGKAIWGVDRIPSWGHPRVQPEQVRNSVYVALAAGCRALGFEADDHLTDGLGRSMLIELALLNEEIDLFEWLIGDPSKSIRLLPTYNPEPPQPPPPQNQGLGAKKSNVYKPEKGPNPTIRAAALGTKDRRGTLLLLNDYSGDVQFQPPQLARNNVVIDIPGLPDAQAYEFSPGDVRVLDRDRVPGGIRVKLNEFGPTSMIYVTTDADRVAELQRAVVRVRPLAINLAIEQAQLELSSVTEIHRMLSDLGHNVKDADEFLSLAEASVKSAMEARDREDYGLAWAEARRATRPIRELKRAEWDQAREALNNALGDAKLPCGPVNASGDLTKRPRLISPVACPPLVSYDTLPKFWTWLDWIKRGRLGRNLVVGGNFEDASALRTQGWVDESYKTPEVVAKLQIAAEGQGRGDAKGCLTMTVAPADAKNLDTLPAFLDHPAAAIRTPPIKVKAAEIVRVSVSVFMPTPVAPGAGGIIVRDSIGGELLQFRTVNAIPEWQDVILYRRAPSDGMFTVTLGYAGYGVAKFDNVQVQKIEALVGTKGEAAATATARPAGPSVAFPR